MSESIYSVEHCNWLREECDQCVQEGVCLRQKWPDSDHVVSHVAAEGIFEGEPHATHLATVWLLTRVRTHVAVLVGQVREALEAHLTLIGLLACVDAHMAPQRG